jgi:hypothetical protein
LYLQREADALKTEEGTLLGSFQPISAVLSINPLDNTTERD